ncbi:MAG: alpha/beta hydrolase [Candidatus Omnitrophica bacterium]|nr:alpha/beta hydrolase [Candidatus Omnitrophota bacterium]
MSTNLFAWLLSAVVLAPNLPGAESAIKLPDDIELVRDVKFGEGGQRPLKMIILRPKQAPKDPMPVIVYIFGGGWRSGNPDQGIVPLTRFAQRGYFCASIDYRLSQEALFPAQIEDCKCAIRFLRAKAKEYNLDPDHIGVWGPSAGGHLAALLGTTGDVKELEGNGGWAEYSSRVNAVVDWFGPTDFLKMDAAGSKLKHDLATSLESRLIGGPIQNNPKKVAKANPITYVSSNDPPFLIMHGDKDPLVPLNQSELLVDALKKAKVPVQFEIIPNAGHGFWGPVVDGLVDRFFDEHLKGDQPLKEPDAHAAVIPKPANGQPSLAGPPGPPITGKQE